VTAEPAALELDDGPWTARRARAQELRERHPFADELLTLYLALLAVQEDAWSEFRESPPEPPWLPRWAADRVLPAVVQATVAAGPAALREAAGSHLAAGTAEDALAGWLAGAELDPVDRYLARASLGPALEALGEAAGVACAHHQLDEHSQHCPRCGGLPQLSWLEASGDELVTGPRSLLCVRCAWSWSCSRSVCPACGESEEARLSVFAERWDEPQSTNGKRDDDEPPVFPHLRIAGCSTCQRYLIEVDMAHDARAVPEVDELTALPLDLYAADQGLTKITPNLMGF
jgi:formate dehydrogenase maturation protein FdhE